MSAISEQARERDYVLRWSEMLKRIRAKGKAACDAGDVRAWAHYAGLHKSLRVVFKGIDPEKDDTLFLETCQTLDMRSRTEPWTLTSPLKAGMIWAMGQCAREVLGITEDPELLWLRTRARKDGLLESSADEHEADERQARLAFDPDDEAAAEADEGDEADGDEGHDADGEDFEAPVPARSFKGKGHDGPGEHKRTRRPQRVQ